MTLSSYGNHNSEIKDMSNTKAPKIEVPTTASQGKQHSDSRWSRGHVKYPLLAAITHGFANLAHEPATGGH